MTLDALIEPGQAPQGKRPLLCLEVNPPRGTDIEPVFERISGKLKGVDFLNVTDCALARMKLAALPFAVLLKQRFNIETLVNVSCRDRNLIALQADLLAGWAGGVRSIVALTGDAVTVGDDPERKGVFEANSIGLLNTVRTLNEGHDLAGNPLNGAPKLACGVVVNPCARNPAAELRRLVKKGEAGARYALSQPVFDPQQAVTFLQAAAVVPVPIMLGLMPFKSAAVAQSFANIPGIRVPESVMTEISKLAPEAVAEASLLHCLEIARACAPLVRGFHVVSGPTPKLGLELMMRLVAEFS